LRCYPFMLTKILICIPTFRRPEGLLRLLKALSGQSGIDQRRWAVEVCVIDNDPQGSALPVVAPLQSGYRFPLHYELETRVGVSFARNRALKIANRSAEWVAFVDDDEVPCRDWLAELLVIRDHFCAHIVCGPVLSYSPENHFDWLLGSWVFQRSRHVSGTKLHRGNTGNVLIHRQVWDTIGDFETKFALTGGEDTHFFRRALSSGFEMRWADHAEVVEWITDDRLNLLWTMRRAFRGGAISAQVEFDLHGASVSNRAIEALKGIARIAAHTALLPVSTLFGSTCLVSRVQRISRGAGLLAATFGSDGKEYGAVRHRDTEVSAH
jgi:succinoglycan biosynthesis protein ExoM